MNNVLIDTNVLVYSTDEDSRFHEEAQNILFESDFELITTIKNISEFLAVVTKGKAPALSVNDALSIVTEFQNQMIILYPDADSFAQFQQLLRKYKPRGLKVHDFEIAAIALANGIDKISTFNKKDFTNIEEIILV